ncbi:thioredoxin-related transmembrane protein 1, partial [Antrostomus carolinensis]|uniref:thioredoxin-related transmembrane protein 1 n=1 Tax=Antrostomus carolinensis TaxID=279965 RepID=UPI000528AF4E
MSSMSALFQLSMWIRHCHGYLTENVGIPVWGSYAVFALATLFSGLILGLIMVFLADCICPSKRHRPPQYPHARELAPESAQLLKKLDEEQEADEEDISDDEAEDKEVSNRNSSPNTVRQRPVNPAATLEKS